MAQTVAATSSDRISSSAAVMTRPGRLMGVVFEGDGTNASSVILYDNASAGSGKILYKLALKASSNDLTQPGVIPDGGVACNNGIYAALAGTGAACVVHYIQE